MRNPKIFIYDITFDLPPKIYFLFLTKTKLKCNKSIAVQKNVYLKLKEWIYLLVVTVIDKTQIFSFSLLNKANNKFETNVFDVIYLNHSITIDFEAATLVECWINDFNWSHTRLGFSNIDVMFIEVCCGINYI